MDNLMELIKFARGQAKDLNGQANILAAYGAPPEDFQPTTKLPNPEGLPRFNVGQKGLGGDLTGIDYALPAPLFGEAGKAGEPSLGQLILGEGHGS